MPSSPVWSLRTTLVRIRSGPRYAAAIACVLLAVVTGIEDAGSTPKAKAAVTVPVVVASRAGAAGHVLGRKDVRLARWPKSISPPGAATNVQTLIGRRLAGPLAAGEPLTSRRLVDPGLADGLDHDTVAIGVDVDTDVRGLVFAGGRADLIAVVRPDQGFDAPSDSTHKTPTARTVCKRTLVLAVMPRSAADSGGTQVILAVSRDQALQIATLRTTRIFTFVTADP